MDPLTDNHVALLCTVQRLYAPYADGSPPGSAQYFEVNLASAIVEHASEPAPDSWIARLTWWAEDAPEPRIDVWYEYDDPSLGKLYEQPQLGSGEGVLPLLSLADEVSPPGAAGLGPLYNRIEAARTALVQREGTGAFLWHPDPDVDSSEPEVGEIRRRWVDFVTSLSTLPAPLPQRLGLSFTLRLEVPPGVVAVWAVPRFVAGTPGLETAEPADPNLAGVVTKMPGTRVTWRYDVPGDAFQLVAYVTPGDVGDPAAPQLIDPGTLWVRTSVPGGESAGVFGEDWSARLESNALTLFDLPQRLIDAFREMLRDPVQIAKLRRPALVGRYRELIVATLRDMAGLGHRPGPNGDDLLQLLRRTVRAESAREQALFEAARQALKAFDEDLDPVGGSPPAGTYEQWTRMLVDVIAELRGLGVLGVSDVPRDPRPLATAGAPLTDADLAEELATWERLQGVVRDAQRLRAVVERQWGTALTRPGAGSQAREFWSRYGAAFRELLARVDVLAWLGAAVVAPVWRDIIDVQVETSPPTSESDRLAGRLGDTLCRYLSERLTPTTSEYAWFTPGVPSHDTASELADVLPFVRTSLIAMAARLVQTMVQAGAYGDEAGENADERVVQTPQGVTVQIDRLGADQPGYGDFLERLSGIGVLLRQRLDADWGPWRCLNMARVEVQTNDDAKPPTFAEVSALSIVPTRPAYRNGFRQAFVSYDNQPLVADSPLCLLSGDYQRQPTEAASTPSALLVVRFSPVEDFSGDGEWARLPSLKFGRRYQLAAFAFGNAGSLPAELVSPEAAHPARLRGPVDPLVIPADSIHEIVYQRRVPVGAPRLGDPGAVRDDAHARFPRILEHVAPLARELPVPAVLHELTARHDAVTYYYDGDARSGTLELDGDTWTLTLAEVDLSGRLSGSAFDLTLHVPGAGMVTDIGGRIVVEDTPSGRDLELSVVLQQMPYALPVVVTLPDPGVLDVPVSMRFSCTPAPSNGEQQSPPGEERNWRVRLAVRVGEDLEPAVEATIEPAPRSSAPAWVSVADVSTMEPGRLRYAPPVATTALARLEDDEAERVPLLLLGRDEDFPVPAGYVSAFTLQLRKPAVDLETFDRWMAGDAGTGVLDLRKAVRKEVVRRQRRNAELERVQAPQLRTVTRVEYVSIDDPAVSRFMWVEIVPVRRSSGAPSRTLSSLVLEVPQPALTAAPTLQDVQRLPVELRCAVGDAMDLQPDGRHRALVTVAPGEVAELRVHPMIPSVHYASTAAHPARFPAAFARGRRRETYDGTTYMLGTPFRVLAEAATAELPDEDTVWTALDPRLSGSTVEVRLARRGGDGGFRDEAFVFAGQAEVCRQCWRWDGRPEVWRQGGGPGGEVPSFPFAEPDRDPQLASPPSSLVTDTMRWEARAFGERVDTEATIHRHAWAVGVPDPVLLWSEDLAADPLARFFRFGVTIVSRYHPNVRRRALLTVPSDAGSDRRAVTPWRRLFVPCRPPGRPAKPRVRFVVPLTEAAWSSGPRHEAAPLMVVLDEPWFEEAGLAERLTAEIVSVGYEAGSPPMPEPWPEFGPDPIVANPILTEPPSIAPLLEVEGPVGHTFDTDTEVPLFLASSFLVYPPHDAVAWSFAKIRFRRELVPAGVVAAGDNPPVTDPSGALLASAMASEPTDPYWVQFLPDAGEWGAASLPEGSYVELLGDRRLRLVTPRGQPVSAATIPATSVDGHNDFATGLLVTRVIADAGGRPAERYLGLSAIEDSGSMPYWGGEEPVVAGSRVRVRLVEIQFRRGAGHGRDLIGDLWRSLFDGVVGMTDARARIVRVSAYRELDVRAPERVAS